MKLTPHEILKYLGINVPEEGLSINLHDEFLYTKLLGLLGERMALYRGGYAARDEPASPVAGKA
ncbi:hypothetical protein ACI2UN_25685 [Ralstonia nicotianae]|uniref:hypothetical protein n=1 Tax=Ralstonia pseudosolanacearum TaxID=1310165 RepID=UPI003C1BD51A